MKHAYSAYRMKRKSALSRLLMVVFFLTLALVGLNQALVTIQARQDQVYTRQVSDMRVLSQALARAAAAVNAGESGAAERLEKTFAEFEAAWRLLNDGSRAYIDTGLGFRASLPGQQQVIARRFAGIPLIREQLGNEVVVIAAGRDELADMRATAAGMAGLVPALQRGYDTVARQLADGNQASATNAVVQRQAWLAERIGMNLALITRGQGTPAQVEQFQRDLNMLGITHGALLDGDRTLGIARVTDAGIRAQIGELGTPVERLVNGAQAVIATVPRIMSTSRAAGAVVAGSESLLAELTALESYFAPGERFQLASPITGYALLLVLLLTIGLYGREVIRQSRAAELFSAEKNKRNNEAVLKLLSEISSLADGDLTVEATVSEDFTGSIADSINYAVGQLRELVEAITSVTVQVTESTESSGQMVTSLKEASRRQSESIDAVYDSIREIGNDISLVSENAKKSLDVAETSVKTAAGGAEVVKDTIAGMDSIREQIQDTSKRIKRLGESSQEIGGFVSLINDIAEHTNTLSLNAAIQAASAGDAGRGFAVVADEVHALAERSSDATRQIESLVKVIQGDITEAVKSMEQTTAEVVAGTGLARRAGDALDDIQQVSRELAELVCSITEASSNQTKSASALTGSMEVIRQVTSRTNGGIEATSEFIIKLGSLTEQLRLAVAGFSLTRDKDKWARFRTGNVTTMKEKKLNIDTGEQDRSGETLPGKPAAFSASVMRA